MAGTLTQAEIKETEIKGHPQISRLGKKGSVSAVLEGGLAGGGTNQRLLSVS